MNTLIRYETPFESLADVLDEVLGESFFDRPGREISSTRWPSVDITEEEGAYTLRADLPGVEKKDVNISVDNGTLTIEGEKKQEHEKREKDRYYHFERSYGSFRRAFSLPESVDSGKIKASFRNGLLELTLPKTEAAKPRKIDVKID